MCPNLSTVLPLIDHRQWGGCQLDCSPLSSWIIVIHVGIVIWACMLFSSTTLTFIRLYWELPKKMLVSAHIQSCVWAFPASSLERNLWYSAFHNTTKIPLTPRLLPAPTHLYCQILSIHWLFLPSLCHSNTLTLASVLSEWLPSASVCHLVLAHSHVSCSLKHCLFLRGSAFRGEENLSYIFLMTEGICFFLSLSNIIHKATSGGRFNVFEGLPIVLRWWCIFNERTTKVGQPNCQSSWYLI